MKKTDLFIRIAFLFIYLLGVSLIWYNNPERGSMIFIGILGIILHLGPILADIIARKFSLSSAIKILFALGTGALVSYLFFRMSVAFLDEPHYKYLLRIFLSLAVAALITANFFWLTHSIQNKDERNESNEENQG